MNYFAHGIRFVDRPWFLAGTAVPDWLSVADRRVRVRSSGVTPFADGTEAPRAELAAGVLQHLGDDRWFHQTAAFVETSAELARLYRRLVGSDNGFRPGFLGHISTELLLDSLLIEHNPRRLDAYYEALTRVDPRLVERSVGQMAGNTASGLARFIELFHRSQFLRDYADAGGLLYRLNQVMRRVGLGTLPRPVEDLLRSGRTIVRDRAQDLLPPEWRPFTR